MFNFIKRELQDTILLLRNIPSVILSLFVVSVISMNLLANKSVDLPYSFLALDCGILISWIAFLTNDIITKHFGPKAATKVSIVAIIINLLICLLFFIASKIPGIWGESYVDGSESVINTALDNTFGGTWYVLLGSTIAFLVSAVVNNLINYLVGKLLKKNPDGFLSFALRGYVSTAIGQFVDNLCFALIVSYNFFSWTITQCLMCSLTGMVLELLFEIIFSPFGYKICENWKKNNVGQEYFNYKESLK